MFKKCCEINVILAEVSIFADWLKGEEVCNWE